MGKRQDIITALKSQLGNIKITNGYNTDLGLSVHEWRLSPFDESELPAVEIRDEVSNVSQDNNNVYVDNALDITITAYGSETSAAGTRGRLYLEDIFAAIGTDEQLGGGAYDINIDSGSLDAEQESTLNVAAIVKITAYYRVKKWSD
jgi:hypothetical protein